ncbi:Endonuclease/exonuclease/phosphatase [Mycena amicta]|nr:Endonuclease/exonuclease/phosphatase [Mycena amicta]
MRILTWNINGVKTVPQYHPWNTFKTHDDILNHLNADIICFQEMKSSRQNLPKAVGIPPSYHSFFSFPLRKTGYSGVAVYARCTTATPLKAEEGLTSLLQPNPPLSSLERVSKPDAYPIERPGSEDLDLRSLDAEGRALVVDFGLFVLINVYCPNDGTGTDERVQFKADFHALLEARVRGLIKLEGREVILLGDLNACAAVIDHAEGPLILARAQAEGIEADDAGGILVDVVRRLHPDRKSMYTCWNTKISARDSNYGSRIDYILITPGLLPWIKAADIQPEIKGSDHCPVFIDLHDSILDGQGKEIQLRDALGANKAVEQDLPRIAAKFWDEYKQRLLSTFFTSKAASPSPLISSSSGTPEHTNATSPNASLNVSAAAQISAPAAETSSIPTPKYSAKRESDIDEPVASSSQPPSKKPKLNKDKDKDKSAPKAKNGQTSLASFFAKPSALSLSSSKIRTKDKGKGKAREEAVIDCDDPTSSSTTNTDIDLDADYQLALKLSQDCASPESPPTNKNIEAKAWGRLLAPPAPPLCAVHGEPAKALTVTKTGPNKGKAFFICSRPVGPGYDAGKATRRRSEVDDQWRCDFFKWASDARREEIARKDVEGLV